MFSNVSKSQSSGSSHLIDQRRKEEDARRSIMESNKNDYNLKNTALWNSKSESVKENTELKIKTNTISKLKEDNVNRRRDLLKELILSEEKMYKIELDAMTENPEQLRLRLATRAAELQASREEKRKEIVEEKLKQQFRESRDELRQIASKVMQLDCVDETKRQLEYKEVLRQKDFEIESNWAKLWEWDRIKKNEKEEKEIAARKDLQDRTKAVVDQQLDEVNKRKQDALKQKLLETQQLNQYLEAEAKRAAEIEEQKNIKKKQSQLETSNFNIEYQKQKDALRRAELAIEKQITEAANEGLEEERIRAIETKKRNQTDMLDYMDFLRRLKEDEKLMQKELERLRQLEQDAAFAKRSVQWDKEKKAREQLMNEVAVTREKQLQDKENEKKTRVNEAKSDREKLMAELARLEELEKKRLEELKVKQQGLRDDLKKQTLERESIAREKALKIEMEYAAQKARDDEMIAKLAKEMAESNLILSAKMNKK